MIVRAGKLVSFGEVVTHMQFSADSTAEAWIGLSWVFILKTTEFRRDEGVAGLFFDYRRDWKKIKRHLNCREIGNTHTRYRVVHCTIL